MKTSTPKEIYYLINLHTGMAVAAAVVPIPLADATMIIGIQVSMIIRIATYYDKVWDIKTVRSFATNIVAASTGIWVASLIKFIPVVGSIGGGILQMSIAGSITYLLGLAVDDIYRHGKPLNKKSFDDVKDKYKGEAKKRAKSIAKQAKKQQKINEEINFRATQTKFKTQITFKFEKTKFSPERIEIREPERGNVVKKFEIKDNCLSYTWKPSSKIKKGHYIAYLFVSDLIPISEKVIYE